MDRANISHQMNLGVSRHPRHRVGRPMKIVANPIQTVTTETLAQQTHVIARLELAIMLLWMTARVVLVTLSRVAWMMRMVVPRKDVFTACVSRSRYRRRAPPA